MKAFCLCVSFLFFSLYGYEQETCLNSFCTYNLNNEIFTHDVLSKGRVYASSSTPTNYVDEVYYLYNYGTGSCTSTTHSCDVSNANDNLKYIAYYPDPAD